MNDALSALSDIFPSTLANNCAFMFTNVKSCLASNVCQDTIPSVLKDAPQFEINNPFALQQNYLTQKGHFNMKREKNFNKKCEKMLNEVKSSEQNALGMLVNLFDWLDGLQPQPITAGQTREHVNPIAPSLAGDLESREHANPIAPNLAGDLKSRGRLAQIIGRLKKPWMVEGGGIPGSIASGPLVMLQHEEVSGKSGGEGNQSRRKEVNQSRDID